ncbi:oocyte zinc finger protein XlCOF20 [Colletotrichum higginsianum]|uniref:Oocyte zinc finger protein XlCOF20 n=1 Tax=Colletotrichum higginsianum (strain IMI 349063) TaxID=759273 RepID=H1W280_COLHI|nr:Oocyte zinc finger protein XlCOF20 [Colletotrichum higginsianum IMI 349063]OBR09528.1 Oocyte zinc finger protein XlCOF20 [Colletotrichum higginsianum IMI 349063]CCF46593.1 oocyte zinc finger protein XlCOF20 [Colletotrichum higginsianum]
MAPTELQPRQTPHEHRRPPQTGASVGEEAMHTSNSRMIQKHPATFQCTLCPKRFTRAFSLRNHLRAHGDVRPFVCSVCGKAFTRQHDRKSHEGLHSGEKKFVCEGDLRAGGQWGCGRRFARASNLGRHFRSECGRVCIKPLLDEELADRRAAWERERMEAWERRATALEPSSQAAAIWPAYGPQHRAAS